MFKAILFDLDGTLLDIDMDRFLEDYFHELSFHLKDYLEPELFIKKLLFATRAMVKSLDTRATNREVFIHHFFNDLDLPQDEIMEHIDVFYQDIFPKLSSHGRKFPHTTEIIAAAKKCDVPLVLATNPIFPRSAILHRMSWAGLSPADFSLITTYEVMRFAKPHAHYFHEIAKKIAIPPEKCLMIGNDADDDIIGAKAAGMITYLASDLLINKSGRNPEPHYCGKLADLPDFLCSLKG